MVVCLKRDLLCCGLDFLACGTEGDCVLPVDAHVLVLIDVARHLMTHCTVYCTCCLVCTL